MAGAMATTIFLESYIESTSTLPAELQRLLITIKALDEKCLGLQQELQANVNALLQMPPQYLQPTPEYDEVSERVASDQKLLVQFAEEKVQLAQQAHDLLEVHALELERVTDDLEKELRRSNPDDGLGLDAYLNDSVNFLDNARGKTPRLDDWTVPLPEPPPSLATAPSMVLAAAAAPPPAKKASQLVASKGKRARDEDGAPFQQLKKKASVAALALPLQPSYEEYGLEAPLQGYEEAPPPAEPGGPVPFMRAPPAGYKASAQRPQAQAFGGETHFLTPADVKQDLVGRHAELFWPDDNLWYLIEIQSVDVATKEARVLYSTGDFETLNLEETAQNMHMVLIPEQMY